MKIKTLLTLVFILIVFIFGIATSESRELVECKGGAGNAIYSVPPVCYTPYCDVGDNVAQGCLLAAIDPPVDPVDPPVDPTDPLYDIIDNSKWYNVSLPELSGILRLTYKVVPMADVVSGVTGGSSGLGSTWSSLAVNVQLHKTGVFRAVRSDGPSLYTADNVIPYIKGTVYDVRIVLNTETKLYSAWVTPKDGTEVLLAEDYRFRKEQLAITSINNFGGTMSSTTDIAVSSIELITLAVPPIDPPVDPVDPPVDPVDPPVEPVDPPIIFPPVLETDYSCKLICTEVAP